MTPQQLIKLAKRLNPEKLARDPTGAIEDAYVVNEAIRVRTLDRFDGMPAAMMTPEQRTEGEELVEQLKAYLQKFPVGPDRRFGTICKEIGVSTQNVRGWLKGVYTPKGKSQEKLRKFLDSHH